MAMFTGGQKIDKSDIDDAFGLIGVAPAEIALVDAERVDPALYGNRDQPFSYHA
jgi:hypothetical protein